MNQNAQLLLPLLGLVLVPSGASGLEVAMNDPSILYSPFTWLVTEVKYFTISFFLFFILSIKMVPRVVTLLIIYQIRSSLGGSKIKVGAFEEQKQ